MITEELRKMLIHKYGNHDFNYALSDTNLKSVIKNHKPKNFDELEMWARKLEKTVAFIHAEQEKMSL